MWAEHGSLLSARQALRAAVELQLVFVDEMLRALAGRTLGEREWELYLPGQAYDPACADQNP